MYSEDVRQRAAALLRDGLSLNRTSQELGVSRATIRDWREHPERSAPPPCPAPPGPSADYAALFGFYLGDGCISRVGRAYSLRICCDARLPGIIADVERCVAAVHPERRTYLVPAPGAITVQSYWKHWPCLFPQHGPGRKHERVLGMADWQWAVVEQHPAAFLRGLFHSDGCRVRNWATRMVAGRKKRYDYPRWQFTNNSGEIRGWCCDALDLVQVPWRRSNWKTIAVSRREAVARLDELIGPKA
jgi:hypothetical protein